MKTDSTLAKFDSKIKNFYLGMKDLSKVHNAEISGTSEHTAKQALDWTSHMLL